VARRAGLPMAIRVRVQLMDMSHFNDAPIMIGPMNGDSMASRDRLRIYVKAAPNTNNWQTMLDDDHAASGHSLRKQQHLRDYTQPVAFSQPLAAGPESGHSRFVIHKEEESCISFVLLLGHVVHEIRTTQKNVHCTDARHSK